MPRQLNAFTETAADLPLFSGAPVPATDEAFDPAPASDQLCLFGRGQYLQTISPKRLTDPIRRYCLVPLVEEAQARQIEREWRELMTLEEEE